MNLEKFGFLEEHVPIKNTYKIKGQTRYLLHPKTKEQLLAFLKEQKNTNIPYFILGGGSNIIISDEEYPGVVIELDNLNKIEYQDNFVYVESGVRIQKLCMDIIDHNLKGLEWASGIPATIGGAIYGNAEAYKTETFKYLKSVTYIDKSLNIVTKKKEELSYGYRTSFFKENKENIILSAVFLFPNGIKEESLKLIEERKKRRIESQPLEYPSAGSVWRNPSNETPTWKIIEELGLKGTQIGGAKISLKHGNFIINTGNATGKDIRNLIQYTSRVVKEKTGIELKLEQEFKDW